MEDIIVIVGPTGIGKTKLSIELAKRLSAEIINGDSVSIYKGLDIGSAKPTMIERDGVLHHLIDVYDVNCDYSVFDYQRDVRKLIAEITSRGKRVIIVGGTGLYIKAALYDYTFGTGYHSNQYDNLSLDDIIRRIRTYTDSLDIDIHNRRRLVRLLNKYENGEEVGHNKDKLLYPCRVIGLTTERSILYNRINERVDLMMQNGLVNEIKSLKVHYKTSRVLKSAIGYKEFYDYLFNNEPIEKVVDRIKLNSRRFAKRQYTFFRHQFDTVWFDVDFLHFENTIASVFAFINDKNN